MNKRPELSETVQNFIQDWVDVVNEGEKVTLGEWIYAFGAMSAMALKSNQLTQEQFEDAQTYLSECMKMVYKNTEAVLIKNRLQ
jgi:hypothetical protein